MSPEAIAREHLAWAVRDGQSPMQIIRSVGGRLGYADVNGKDAEKAVASAWIRLRARRRRRGKAA
ncbi:MAG TPA: hypothetical protein VHM01_07385 [Alphaproteobacteria bacterium]|nr:hypothetical protein [Alphaproteobacteria bacterium]